MKNSFNKTSKKFGCIFFMLSLFFSCSTRTTDFENDSKSFIASIKAFQHSSEMIRECKDFDYQTNMSKYKLIIEEMNKGIELSHNVRDEFLDEVNPELKFQYRNNLVKSQEIFIQNIGEIIKTGNSSYTDNEKANQLLNTYIAFETPIKEELFDDAYDLRKITLLGRVVSIFKINIEERSYMRMFVRLLISNVLAILIFSVFSVIIMIPLLLIGVLDKKLPKKIVSIFSVPALVLVFVCQFYFWMLWASYCSIVVFKFIENPNSEHHWLYYLTGFFAVSAPIALLSNKEEGSLENVNEKKRNRWVTGLVSFSSVVIYIILTIYPELMEYKFISWFNNLIL